MQVVNIFGVGTPRYNSALPVRNTKEPTIDIALGSCIARWNLQHGKRTSLWRAHTDLVTGIIQVHPDKLVTTSHGGEVSLWDNNWNKLQSVRVKVGKVTHCSANQNGTLLLATSEYLPGLVSVISIQDNILQIENEFQGEYLFAEWNPSEDIFVVKQTDPKPIHQRTQDEMHKESKLIVFDKKDGKHKKMLKLNELVEVAAKNESHSLVALSFVGRKIKVVNSESLETMWSMTVPGSGIFVVVIEGRITDEGLIISLAFSLNDTLICPSDNGQITIWERDKPVKEVKGPHGSIYYIAQVDQRLWVTSMESIHSISLEEEAQSFHKKYHDLTCCGIDFHPNGELVASGDFGCNVIVWDVETSLPKYQTTVGLSVRSLTWKPDGSSIQVGCLDGIVYNWNYADETQLPEVFFSLTAGVTCIKWSNEGEKPTMIAAGTTDGTLAVLQVQPGESIPRIKLAIKAHKPKSGPQDLNFGSIGKYAEIWSLAWSPDSTMIATSSEDQTTCIWNLNGELLHTLVGHTTAVTSVDWKETQIGTILATCADDKSVRIWDGITFELKHKFTTEKDTDWHTVTYVALEVKGKRIVCATQNGHVFMWDLVSHEVLHAEKLHLGSVEGLVWHSSGRIATCSSDCTVHIYDTITFK